jgi:hypothetical protein
MAQTYISVPANGYFASTDRCWRTRARGAWQADITVWDTPSHYTQLFSPTIQVQ